MNRDTNWDRARWENWPADVVVERPERHYHPRSREEVVQAIRSAEGATPPRKVRGCGSHWALSDVAVSPDWFLETSSLRATRYDVIPEALSDEARRVLVDQRPGNADRFTLYHVEGGITIRDLNLRLDRQPLPDGDAQWRRMPTDELLSDSRTRWALPTMPGSSGQTIAGAISTGSHGGEHGIPPLADIVLAIHLVTVGGEELWIERSEPITDPERLARALPGVVARYSTELFDAALVSVGRMGVIYGLVLKVVEQYSLEQRTTVSTWDAVEALCCAPYAIFEGASGRGTTDDTRHGGGSRSVFVEVVLLPYARADGSRTCFLTHRWKVPDDHRTTKAFPDLFTLVCRSRTIRPFLLALLGVATLAVIVMLTLPGAGVGVLLAAAIAMILSALSIWAGGLSIGDLLSGACNACNRLGQAWLIRAANEWVIARFRSAGVRRDVGYEVTDMNWSGLDCYRADSVEVFFDADSGRHVAFVRDEILPAFERAAARRSSTAGYVSLRFTGRSSALLAMQRWETTCGIEVAFLQGIEGNVALHDELQAAAVRHGGTVHWGQHNTLSRSEVARAFPALPRWQAQLRRLGAPEALQVFDNEFCRRRDLEPR